MKLDLREIPVHYINLDSDIEKKESVENALAELNFKNFNRFSAIRGTNNSSKREDGTWSHDSIAAQGCAASHAALLKELTPPFIILEDDCLPKSFSPILEFPDDADCIYLGISDWGRAFGQSGPFVHFKPINETMAKIYNMLSTHAMLFLNQEYQNMCRRIAENAVEIANHLDIGYAEIHRYFNVYAPIDPLFFQSTSPPGSTNTPLNIMATTAAHGLRGAEGMPHAYKVEETPTLFAT